MQAPTTVALTGGTTYAVPFNSSFVLPVAVTNTDTNSVLAPNGALVACPEPRTCIACVGAWPDTAAR